MYGGQDGGYGRNGYGDGGYSGGGGYGGGGGGGYGGGRRGGRGGGGGGRSRDSVDYYTDPENEQFRKLFIGGLSYETTKEGLQEHFEKWGEITDCVVMTDPKTKRSKGFGFVTYKESSMVDEAQSNRPHTIDGREVESKRPMPRDESQKEESKISTERMFIGGCDSNTVNEDSLRETFQEFGAIKEVSVIKDKETGKPKGYCFITFEDSDSVDKCVLRKQVELDGKRVDVKKAKSQSRGGGGGGGRGGGGRGRGGRGGGGGYGGGRSYGSGGYSGGGYGQSSGGYGSGYGGGQDSYYGGDSGYSSGSYGGGGYGSQGGYSSSGGFGSDYGDSYGGGAMKGGSYSRSQPYNRY